MDRWPSERIEPKAPDKNVDTLNSKDNNIIMKLKAEPHFPNCGKTDDYSPRVLPPSKESSVSSLNEPDLKALLEEAMAYKRPKDIQGKSELFKITSILGMENSDLNIDVMSGSLLPGGPQVLTYLTCSCEGATDNIHDTGCWFTVNQMAPSDESLDMSASQTLEINIVEDNIPHDSNAILNNELLQSVECEKKYTSILSRPEKQSNRKPRRKQMNKKEIDKTTHEGPFQDLIVHMSDSDSTTKRQTKYSLKCSPSNVAQLVPVDASSYCQENNSEVSALLENGTIDSIEELQEMLAAEANIYQIKEVPAGPADSRTAAHPFISNSYHEESEEETEARFGVKDTVNFTSSPKESGDLSELGREALAESKKSLDENGNAVGSNSRIENLAERKAKARRLKAKNDRNTILSHHIEGHRSDIAQDIDAIMKYIESPKISDPKSGRQRNSVGLSKHASRTNNKISRIRDKSTEAFSRKPPKSKENKLHKSSSLEEVSISKFEDLTQGDIEVNSSKATTKSRNDKILPKVHASRSKGSGGPSPPKGVFSLNDKCEPEQIETDFLPVMKKNRKKKATLDNSFPNGRRKITGSYRSDKMLSSYIVKSQKLDGFPSSSREFKRRKSISSIPSSDKSGDSSDLDSVHSFPVSSSKGKGNKPSVSLYTGSTPQISYADIARSVPSPSRLHTELSPSIDNVGECEYDSLYSPREIIPTVILQLPTKKENLQSSVDLHQDYPPLNVKCADKNFSSSDMFVEYTVLVPKRNSCTFQSNCVNVEETVLIEMPSSDISEMEGMNIALDNQLTSKRPPVILMNNNTNDSNEVNDLVFGFEVNEQLLSCSHSESLKNSDIRPIEKYNKVIESVGTETISMESPNITYLVQSLYSDHSQNHMELVHYVSSEWESALSALQNEDSSSKVVYFSP